MERFVEHELIPDVIDVVPSSVLNIEFAPWKRIQLGNQLTIKDVSEIPSKISFAAADPNKFYTLIFTDPDAPSRATPTVREWVHWMVVNIPGNADKNFPEKGETLIEFVPSSPGEGSGLHRYTFLVYEQPGKLDFSGEPCRFDRSVEHRVLRRHFSARNFAKKWNFVEIPVAGNFFITEWDEYVAVVKKMLGIE